MVEMLDAATPMSARLARLRRVAGTYNGFNLICTDEGRPYVYESVPGAAWFLDPGVHGLSNHLLDTPWPKVEQARERLTLALGSLPDDRAVLDLFRDERSLPTRSCHTPACLSEREQRLSSILIRGLESAPVLHNGAGGEAARWDSANGR